MIDRRFLLKAGATAMLSLTAGQTAAAIEKSGRLLAPIMDNESLPAYLKRTLTESDPTAYARWLGAANDYKEGDGIVGVAAPDPVSAASGIQLVFMSGSAAVIIDGRFFQSLESHYLACR